MDDGKNHPTVHLATYMAIISQQSWERERKEIKPTADFSGTREICPLSKCNMYLNVEKDLGKGPD